VKELKIVRLEETDEGAVGVLLIDGLVHSFTLEPDSGDKKKSQIPLGSYHVRRFHGNKWKDTFEIVVPGHTAVLFHSGNTEEHTQMCVLLGEKEGYLKGERAVLESGMAFKSFMEIMGEDQEAKLFVVKAP
jgi:hypothetical protein